VAPNPRIAFIDVDGIRFAAIAPSIISESDHLCEAIIALEP
jgi:hypothetical protein